MWVLAVGVVASLIFNVVALHQIATERAKLREITAVQKDLMAMDNEGFSKIGEEMTNQQADLALLLPLVEKQQMVLATMSSMISNTSPSQSTVFDLIPRVISKAARVTESNDQWWRWAYTFRVWNPSAFPARMNAKVTFMDANGFIIDYRMNNSIEVYPHMTNSFADSELIDLPGAENVKAIRVELIQL